MGDFTIQLVNLEHRANQERHQTQDFHSSNVLVVRRGTPFRVTLQHDGRPFHPGKDTLMFRACLGRLHETFPVTSSSGTSPTSWNAFLDPEGSNAKALSVFLCPPASASVGRYNLQVFVLTAAGQTGYEAGDFVLLFNPWCSGDSVYMPSEEQREEYVLCESGLLYMGTPKHIVSRPWHFDQFEPMILEICLKLLQVSPPHLKDPNKDFLHHYDPVYISRIVSAMINCEDDKGVLKGKWSGDYRDGTLPSDWTGSGDILKQWARSGCSPVKYGQCWVFAAVMCTVMRALGIPTRVVSNFNSAHDTNGNMVIEEFYNEAGLKLPQSRDSIWNFHVWVECWMTRPDLGTGLDGWQVLDPTPQEMSGGVFCCGPAPVAAIRDHRVGLPYDIPFVFAEVNASVRVMVVRRGQVVGSRMDRGRVGSLLCTKAVGSLRPHDVTGTYKHVRGLNSSIRSRSSASSRGSAYSRSSSAPHSGLAVSLSLHKTPIVGETILFTVTVTNTEPVAKVISEHVNAQAKAYSHAPSDTLWEAHNTIHLAPLEVKALRHHIPPGHYELALGDNLVNLAVVLMDQGSQERVLASEEFNVAKPQLLITLFDERSSKEHAGTVQFTNPFSVPVSGLLSVVGPGLIPQKLYSRIPLLPPGHGVERMFTYVPRRAGTKMVQASFALNEISTVFRGVKMVYVN